MTEAIKPGIIATSHLQGRWRLEGDERIGAGMSALVDLDQEGTEHGLRVLARAAAWSSSGLDAAPAGDGLDAEDAELLGRLRKAR